MGNSGSQPTGHSTHHQRPSPILIPDDENQWTHSFPRSPSQHKLIVPDRDAHQRLRPTGNGEILHAGGTISGRSQQWQGINRSSSIPAVRQRRASSPQHNIGQYSPHQQQQHHRQQQQQQQQQQKTRIPAYRHNQPRVLTPSYRKDQIKRFGSEPDLRGPSKSMNDYHDRYKGRKKYKAPQPPLTPLSSIEKHHADFDDNCGLDIGSPIRRARLFKTRAETKKKISSPVHNRRSIGSVHEFSPLEKQHKYKSTDALFASAHIDNVTARKPHESNLSNNGCTTSNNSNNGTVQSGRPSIPPMQRTRSSPEFQAELKQVTRRLVNLRREAALTNNDSKLKTLDHNINKKNVMRNKLKEMKASREMMIMEERTPASGKESTPELSPPKVKTFYFGMEHDEAPSQKIPNSIGSDISSESETEASGHDISLQLRPILPKKQLEIPRFSPAAAWKLLSSVDTNTADSTLASEEGSVFACEDRIEKLARPPPPYRLQMGQRSNHDKSGDSGISGDETPDAVLPSPRQRGISWTPQQDLGDDSSLEDGSNLDFPNTVKFPTRPHVFSLSLPRENHLATYINEKTYLQPYSSLQKLKRSMSGVLATLAKKDNDVEQQDTGENWFLSRSAPNSLNNGFSSLELRRQHKQDEYDGPKQTRRIMYLPQSNLLESSAKKKHLSKSYENISTMESKGKPQNLQDPPKDEHVNNRKWTKKPKKFTFQSTVRQIERKRLADKLSKEAERKEQQRLRELEAMQRVEEEFQKKRAREKATIRQQLRLYSMDETSWSSLPPNLEMNEEVRAEPDGAVSSSTSSPTFKKNNADKESKAPVTQILSEFRQSHREYKEFRSGARYASDQHQQHATTVHPRVTCNMPKATDNSYTSGNYRKYFAHGHGIRSGEQLCTFR